MQLNHHTDRFLLAEEVHARPPMPLATPSRASYMAVLIAADEREREQAHLAALCERFAIALPPAGATHFSAKLGDLQLKWERHGEFSGYTFFLEGNARAPFEETAAAALPSDWMSGIPGSTLVAAHVILMIEDSTLPSTEVLFEPFAGNQVVGSEVGDGAGIAYSDFKIHGDGFSRFLLIDRSFTPRQAGRTLQRLLEIETYRMMALLALPIAWRKSARVLAIEKSLAELTEGIARDSGKDEVLLHELTRLAAEVESSLAKSQFRFGACRAYAELVNTRIGELREKRIPAIPTISEFMARRFTPAVATCNTVSQRLHELSERVAQASSLLSTRVNIAREQQNQMLLASMDRRAKQQLRLQQTVEGLSVAAIVYYLAGLVGYLAKGLNSLGLQIKPDLAVAVAIPLIAALIIWSLRRARRRITEADKKGVYSD
jgi:uncharacterized membrane-anchored protein